MRSYDASAAKPWRETATRSIRRQLRERALSDFLLQQKGAVYLPSRLSNSVRRADGVPGNPHEPAWRSLRTVTARRRKARTVGQRCLRSNTFPDNSAVPEQESLMGVATVFDAACEIDARIKQCAILLRIHWRPVGALPRCGAEPITLGLVLSRIHVSTEGAVVRFAERT